MGNKKSIKVDYDFRLYVNCPECGRLILRSEDTDNSDIPCSKCGAKLNVSIKDETVTTRLLKPSKRRMAAMNEYKRRISSTFTTSK